MISSLFHFSDLLKKYESKLAEIQQNYTNGLLSYPKEMFLQEMSKFGVGFAYHSNRIEGNPLSYRDVGMLLNDRDPLTPANKPPSISAPPIKPTATGTAMANNPGNTISFIDALVDISIHFP